MLKANNMTCPRCGAKQKIVKYGKYKNTQRFKCKKCKKIFLEKNYTISKRSEKILAMSLLNLIKKNIIGATPNLYTNFDLSQIMPNENINEKEFKEVSIVIKNMSKDDDTVNCNNPRVVLCLVNNEIRIIKILKEFIYEDSEDLNKGHKISLYCKPDEKYESNKEQIIVKY